MAGGIKAKLLRLTFGNLAYLGAQFVAFVALAQWATLAEVGRFSWALALTSPIFLFADMRTSQIQLSSPPEQVSYRTFVYQRVAMQLLASPVAIGLGLAFAPDRETFAMVLGLTVLKNIEGLINVSLTEHMRFEAMGVVAAIQLVRGILYALVFSLSLFFSGSAIVAIWLTAVILLVPAAQGHLTLPRTARSAGSSRQAMLLLTRDSWSIGLGFFIGSLTVNGPRFLIESYNGVEALGVFAAVSYVIVLANTVVDSVTQGLMPRFSSYWRAGQGRRALNNAFRICALVGLIGLLSLLVSALFGDTILRLLYGAEFAQGKVVLIALFVWATLQYIASALRSVLITGGMRSGVLWTSVINMVVTLALALLWLPTRGAEFAGWALACGQLAQLLIYVWFAARAFRGADQHVEKKEQSS
ncbi:lipopolysaccharide biosynthesis protein [Corynebacterium nasicanis]|uniref:Lipopolysaccharide biosynthesis protein n=1 Tax=Corynebacterium nasicanis TaxID=1448267 RepID=A0ABW1QBE5_9CORY